MLVKPGRDVVAFALTAAMVGIQAAAAQPGERFHTSPECWDAPRIYHSGPPSAEIADRIRLVDTPAAAVTPGEPMVSPNGGYRFWVRNPDTGKEGPWSAGLIVDVERPTRPTLLFDNVAQPIAPSWLNEKLIFVRVAWGRVVFSDVIFDVESSKIIYNEEARDGQLAFEQYRQACGGRCPCVAADGATAPLPASKPGAGVLIGLLELPTIFGPGEVGGIVQAPQPKAVAVFDSPDANAPVTARPIKPQDLDYQEIGYEQGAAVVYEERPGWYRIGLAPAGGVGKRSGWVKAGDAGAYAPLEQLLVARMTYLNEHWSGDLWDAPEAGSAVQHSPLKHAEGRQEYSVEVRETRLIDRGLWLKVALHKSDPCEGGQSEVAAEGWVPAYSKEGQLVIWYHSRGC